MEEFFKIYPNNKSIARRKENNPVGFEMRSDNDRRTGYRPVLAESIKTDIYELQNTFKTFNPKFGEFVAKVNKYDNVSKNANCSNDKTVISALSPIIPIRRLSSAPDKIENKDYWGVATQIGIAGMLLPEDLRDTKDGLKQILHKILPRKLKAYIANSNKKLYKNFIQHKTHYDHREFQTSFSFIRGSVFEPLVNKFNNKFGYTLHQWDKTLLDTKLGQKIKTLLNIDDNEYVLTGRNVKKVRLDQGEYTVKDIPVKAKRLKGAYFNKLICRALKRTTLYGILALSAISIPSIVMAFNKPKNTKDKAINVGKQAIKSAVSVISVTAGIALIGALLAPVGSVGSVVGMGIGSVIGGYISSKINKNIKQNNY